MPLPVAVSCPRAHTRPTALSPCCPAKDRARQRPWLSEGVGRVWEAGCFCSCQFGKSTAWGLGFPSPPSGAYLSEALPTALPVDSQPLAGRRGKESALCFWRGHWS